MMEAKRRAWVDVGLWVLAQLTVTSVPGSAVPVDVHHPFDWLVHAALYGMLGLLIARAAAVNGWAGRRLVWMLLIVSVAAAADEAHQLVIPGRNGSAMDWVFDTAGVAAGLLIGRWMMASAAVAKWLR